MDLDENTLFESAREAAETPDEDIREFLHFIGNRACEACGEHRWFPINDRKISYYPIANHPYETMPVLVVLCGNCGNTRSFAWARVSHYLNVELPRNG